MRPIPLLLLAACCFLPSLAAATLFERSTPDLQAETRAAAAEGKGLALFLTLPDCPGCREMERTVFNEKSLNAAVDRQFRHLRLEINGETPLTEPGGKTSTPAAFAQRLRAVATPAFAFFDARGQLLYRHTGALDARGFGQLLDFVERGEYERQPFVLKPGGGRTGSPPPHAGHLAPQPHKGTASVRHHP